MKRVLAVGVSGVLVVVLALVVFGPSRPSCSPTPFYAGGDTSGLDVPAEPVPVTTSAPFTARIATWNTLYKNSTGRVTAGVTTIAAQADVIGLQEFNPASRRATVARVMAKRGWGMTDGNNSVQILYNAAKYKLLAQDSVKVIDVVRIEGGTAGTSIGPKSLQWVQLQDRATGGVFFVLNMHIVPDIDRKGHPRKAPKRLAVRDTQRATALSVIAKLRKHGPVAWTEDSNVDNRNDQRVQSPRFDYRQMKAAGMSSNWSALGIPTYGTQSSGRRVIDKINLTLENGRFLTQRRLGTYGSDHHAAVATISRRGGAATEGDTTVAQPAPALPASLTVPGWKLDADQIQVAATAIEVGKQLGVPERGWIVAIAAALTESEMRNLDHGDRDSVGPWQMRPSTGWGTVAQIRNLTLGARAFYGLAEHTRNPGLVDISGWEQLSVGQAAQAVEVSAHPSRYTKNETAARAIVAQLAGSTGSGTTVGADDSCDTTTGTSTSDDLGSCPVTGLPAESHLTSDALLALRCVKQQYPSITSIGGVRADALPDHPSGRAVDFMIPHYQTAAGKAVGWQVARWLRANRIQLGVSYVIFDNKIWSVAHDDDGWRVYRANGQGNDSSLHYNHVHVTVYGNAAKPDGPTDPGATGSWQAPLSAAFPARCGFHGAGCNSPYPSHTGQDFPAPAGTPVHAVTNGTVIRSESLLSDGGTCASLPICGGAKRSYGNLLVIQVAGGGEVTAWYAHLTERRVRVGDTVHTGQIIGTVGYQGHVIPQGPGGAHLHFEIRTKGTPINPLPYLRTKGIQA